MAGVIGPDQATLRAFRELQRLNYERLTRLAQTMRADQQYRERLLPRWGRLDLTRPEILFNLEGTAQMRAEYAVRNFLVLRADLRRMEAAKSKLAQSIQLDGLRDPENDQPRWLIEDKRVLGGMWDRVDLDETVQTGARLVLPLFERLLQVEDLARRPDALDQAVEFVFALDEAQLALAEAAVIEQGRRNAATERRDTEARLRELWRRFIAAQGDLPGLSREIRTVMASRLLSPNVSCTDAAGQERGAWEVYPWLGYEDVKDSPGPVSDDTMSELYEALSRFDVPDEIAVPALDVLVAILSEWSEDAALFRRRLAEGLAWPSGSGAVNLIPSPHSGPCYPVLVVVCSGRTQFHANTRLAVEHFFECANQTRVVIFVSDYWDGTYFGRERLSTFEHLQAHYGVRTFLLLKTGSRFGFLQLA